MDLRRSTPDPKIHIANAPCSWGTLEFEGVPAAQIGYPQMLDELAAAGYAGTELGDWGYMPTESPALRRELEARHLSLRGAFVPVALRDASTHAEGLARAVRTARLICAAGDADDRPVLVLSDENGADDQRRLHAGRITQGMGLSDSEWTTFAKGANAIARAVRTEANISTVFHPHCAGFVETQEEIDIFLARTDPALVGIVFDTGHYAYGAGGCEAVMEGLERFWDRVYHMHFKDYDADIAAQARRMGWDYFEAVGRGLFCELGQGCVDFPAVKAHLRESHYDGWIVVEQDVLPGMGSPKESAERNRAYLRRLGL